MALRLTSRRVNQARIPRDETLVRGEETEEGLGEPSSQATDVSAAPRDLNSGKKVVAADVALDWVLQEIAQQARLATSATGAFIAIMRGRSFICKAISGSNAAEFIAYLNRDRRMLDSCLAAGDAQRCRDSETCKELDANTCRNLGARSVVIVPITDAKDAKLGAFGVFSPQVDAFSSANIIALETLSRRIADAFTQIDRCTSATNGSAPARRQSEPGKSSLRNRVAHAIQRPLPAIPGRVAWVLGILVLTLLVGWIFSRNINQWTTRTSAKSSAAVASEPVSLSAPPPSSDHPSSGSAKPSSVSAPVVRGVVKEAAKAIDNEPVPSTPASKAGKKIIGRSAPRVPELEIENTLDDAFPETSQSASLSAAKTPSQSTTAAILPAGIPSKNATSTNNGSSAAAGDASVGSPTREAVRMTRAPDPASVEITPPSKEVAQKVSTANAGPAPEGPVMVSENAALERISEQLKPDYPPDYPADLRTQHSPATVVVDVVVGKDGQVESVTPLKGDSRLMTSAAKAVAKWRFTPLPRDHRFVRFESHVTVQFVTP
jgi:TonB family protein